MTTLVTPTMSPPKGWLVPFDQAVTLLRSGQTVAVPTETVYGLAASAYDTSAIEHIYRLKQRPSVNPLIVHYAHWKDTEIDVIWQPWALTLAQSVWPGPVTFVLPLRHNSRLSSRLTAGLTTVAVRVPQHPLMTDLLRACRVPLAAPSANESGLLSPTSAHHVVQGLAVPVLDGGPCALGIESTILDATGDKPRLLRHGAWEGESTLTALTPLQPTAQSHDHPIEWSQLHATTPPHNAPICPGQWLAHYAPRKRLRINADTIQSDEGLLAFGPPCDPTPWMVQLSAERNLVQAARHLFAGLFELDHMPCSRIAVMPIPMEGLGRAINDRLSRACHASHHSAPPHPTLSPHS